MKSIALLIALIFAMPASADFAKNLVTNPASENPVPPVPLNISARGGAEYFFYIAATSTTDSSWMYLPKTLSIDVCLDNDVALADTSTSTLDVEVMFIPARTYGRPTGQSDHVAQAPLLGAVLDGVAQLTGSPNDCIRNIIGDIYFKINVLVADATQAGLVSVTVK